VALVIRNASVLYGAGKVNLPRAGSSDWICACSSLALVCAVDIGSIRPPGACTRIGSEGVEGCEDDKNVVSLPSDAEDDDVVVVEVVVEVVVGVEERVKVEVGVGEEIEPPG